MMRECWYCWKAQASWAWIVLLAVYGLLLALLLGGTFRPHNAPHTVREVALILEVYLPLVLAVLLAGAPTLERDAGAAELHLTYRQRPALRLLQFVAIPVILWSAAVLTTALIASHYYVALSVQQVASMTWAPALALGGAALAGSAAARHQGGGMIAALLWWGIDFQAPGRVNRWVYLINVYQPMPDMDPADMRMRLAALGLAGLGIALWLAGRRERWVRGQSG